MLSKEFDKVIVVTRNVTYERKSYSEFDNYRLNPESDFKEIIKVFYYILRRFTKVSSLFFNEIIYFLNKRKILSVSKFGVIIHDLFKACCTANSIEKIIRENKIHGELVLYSYWLTHSALATLIVKCNSQIVVKCVSRGHGGDLYEERNKLNYLSFRYTLLNKLDQIYCISQHGKNYLLSKYGYQFKEKTSVFYLASPKPTTINLNKPNLNYFVLVSCAFVNPVKRIDLTLDAIRLMPDLPLKWIHLGGGPLLEQIVSDTKELISSRKNLEIIFKGNLTTNEIKRFYETQYVDLFINNSQYEGLPVSMMEAQSYGIPIIGLDIGGVSEIVTDKTGILLPANAKAEKIAQAIYHFINLDEDLKNRIRFAALNQWKEKFNPETNFSNFTTHLNQLLHANP